MYRAPTCFDAVVLNTGVAEESLCGLVWVAYALGWWCGYSGESGSWVAALQRGFDELGSGVSVGETNSAGAGYYLWGVSQGVALARWGENRGESNGGNALWKRHTVAPRGG
jgi:hypothetical protein